MNVVASAHRSSWQTDARILAAALFVVYSGFNFTASFVPVCLMHLGVTDVGDAAVMAGYAAMLSSVALAVSSPLWGMVADRLGCKLMLIRATFFGAVVVGGMGFAAAPWHVPMFRFLQGGFTSIRSAGPALMSTIVLAEPLDLQFGTNTNCPLPRTNFRSVARRDPLPVHLVLDLRLCRLVP